ncbi:MAG: hypothetical protein HW383_743 [Candidatus Magasanikbacteria bacterium]|nr:hypothetical protein [Candidatus Magasanikbacteria bacterium]
MDDQIIESKHFKKKRVSGGRGGKSGRARTAAGSKQMDKHLSSIYEDGDDLPDMKSLEQKPRRGAFAKLAVTLLVLAVLGGAAWAGLILLNPKRNFSEEKIIFTAEAPATAVSGSIVNYIITFGNTYSEPVAQAEINVRYPDDFSFTSSTIESFNDEHTVWKIGGLRPGEVRTLQISGTVNGAVGADVSLRTFFTYRPASFNADFQKTASAATKLAGHPITLQLTLPKSVNAGAEVPLKIALTNDAPEKLTGFALHLALPPTMRLTASSPTSTSADVTTWAIASLEPGKTQTFMATGTFAQEAEGEQPLAAELFVQASPEKKYLESRAEAKILVDQALMAVTLFAQGSNGIVPTQPGKILNFSVGYTNRGKVEVKNAVLKVLLETPSAQDKSIFSWDGLAGTPEPQISGKQKSKDVRSATLTWTAKEFKALAKIAPGETGTIDFSIPLRSLEDLTTMKFPSAPITAKGAATFTVGDGDAANTRNSESGLLTIYVNSDLDLTVTTEPGSEALLSAEEKAAKKTAYTVSMKLVNSFHDLKNISVGAVLFGDGEVVDSSVKTSVGAVTFDDKTRAFTWTVESMPVTTPEQTTSFTVLVTKNETQTALSDALHVKATDLKTNQEMSVAKNGLPL